MWPSKARKSRSERGRSGASSRAPSTRSAAAVGRAGLDEGDHVAVEAEVDARSSALERADPRAGARVVGHETHRRTASSIFT